MPANALAVPWPIFFFGVALMIGLIFGALIAQIQLFRRWRDYRGRFLSTADGAPSPVAAYYRDRTAGPTGATNGNGPAYDRNREAIARAWTQSRLTAEEGAAAAWVSEAQQDGGNESGSQRDCGGVTGSSGTAGAAGGSTTGPMSPSGA
jgi:hypothetical protein